MFPSSYEGLEQLVHGQSVRASAPGRVNLVGEHTDYNGGYVLPLILPLRTHVVLARRNDRLVSLKSVNRSEEGTSNYRLGEEKVTGTWIDYIQGLTWVLEKEGFPIETGFELGVASDIPAGSGLSSSAALEVAVLKALREFYRLDLDDKAVALLAHKAEHDFVGAKVGVMDQMISSLGKEKQALFLQTKSLSYQHIPLPDNAELWVVNSGVTHSHAFGKYNTRREECAEAARLLGVGDLSQLTEKDLVRVEKLPSPLDRRVRHVVTENRRVLEVVRALGSKDARIVGELFYESHESMRDDYEVSIPEIDFLVKEAREEEGVYGARLTGGGFGGCVIYWGRPGKGEKILKAINKRYSQRFDKEAVIVMPFSP